MEYINLFLTLFVIAVILSIVFRIIAFMWPVLLGAFIGLMIYRYFLIRKIQKQGYTTQETYYQNEYHNASSQDVIDADIEIVSEEETDRS